MTAPQQYVLFPLGTKRFAMPADRITELARPDTLHSFPHSTSFLSGVLLRRGRVIPVCDIAPVVVGPDAPSRKFYLIAVRSFGRVQEWTALPVSGECELLRAQAIPPAGNMPPYVSGLLPLDGEIVEIIDLETLVSAEGAA